MLTPLKPFVPSRVCLSCDGCCRFKEADSVWRPQVGKGERGPAEKILTLETIDGDGYLKTRPCRDFHVCRFFRPDDHICTVYHARPFDCELYPFLLCRHEGQAALKVHLNCPHVQEHRYTKAFDAYVAYLKEYFADGNIKFFLRQNPALLHDYSAYEQELEFLFIVSLG